MEIHSSINLVQALHYANVKIKIILTLVLIARESLNSKFMIKKENILKFIRFQKKITTK